MASCGVLFRQFCHFCPLCCQRAWVQAFSSCPFERSQSPGTRALTPEHLSTALVQSHIASQVFLVCVVLLPASLSSRWVSVAVHSRCRTFRFPPASFPGPLIPIYTCCCHTAHLGGSSGRLPACQPAALGYLTLVSLEVLELCRRWSKHPRPFGGLQLCPLSSCPMLLSA